MFADKYYTTTQAARQLPNILNFVEQGNSAGLTRYGKPVAILASITKKEKDFQNDFWQALQKFQEQKTDDFTDWHDALTDIRETSRGKNITL